MFEIGQKVVCIRGSQDNNITVLIWGGYHVHEGEVYTIRGFAANPIDMTSPGVYLEEIINPSGLLGDEVAYRMDRFRPIVEKKTDISVFTEMLNKAGVTEDA